MSKNSKKHKGKKSKHVEENIKEEKNQDSTMNKIENPDYEFNQNDEDLILKAFQHFDNDNTGKINVEDIKHVLTFLGDIMTKDEVNTFFQSVEIDKNGYLDYREFINFWMKDT